MNRELHIDVETFSSIDIKTSGSYRYMESPDFEILMVCFAFDDDPVTRVDLKRGEKLPKKFIKALRDPSIEKHAHNATFERNAFKAIGYDIPIDQWHCSLVKAAYCGLPLGLDGVSKALNLGEKGKSSEGKALIKFFSVPIKPTKSNGMITRHLPEDDLEKWERYLWYCEQDVIAEREVSNILSRYEIPKFERDNYILDQIINDFGIEVDLKLAQIAYDTDNRFVEEIKEKVKQITGVDNPNSPKQLKGWLGEHLQREIKSLAKDEIDGLIEEAGLGPVADVLNYRKKLSKTSTKKYASMLNCVCENNRVHGLFQFYGANRTGRWAGRLVQLQNLARNMMKDLDNARAVVMMDDYEALKIIYDDISSILSQLVRTAFVAGEGNTFCVADFSAIEARVLSWLAGETWREDVFKSHGKIYEASASMMFNVPIEQVTKGSDLRAKGKNAELALGYQGAVGAMRRMGAEEMGMSEIEMKSIVKKWRKANPNIVQLWYSLEECAKSAVRKKGKVVSEYKGLIFDCDDLALTIQLPSGRKLFYWDPKFKKNKFDSVCVAYRNIDQKTRQWLYTDTYGGKIVENVVQAISRDILADSMLRLHDAGFNITMHVHDEAITQVPKENCEEALEKMCDVMGEDIPWAEGLPLVADGYITEFYKKD
jgi:DNA polymerase bacteriophage-type